MTLGGAIPEKSIKLFWLFFALTLTQSHAGAFAVLVDELDTDPIDTILTRA